jgi:type VI secretion system protein ImpL
MNPILGLITKLPKTAGLISALTILLVLMWFLLPMIELSGVRPFAGTTARLIFSAIVLLIVAAIAVVNKILSIPKTPPTEAELAAKAAQLAFRLQFKRTSLALKKTFSLLNKQRRHHLWHSPWYIIVGPMDSGKATLARQTGLDFTTTSDLMPESLYSADHHTGYQVYLAKEAVLLSISHPMEGDAAQSAVGLTAQDPTWMAILRFMRFYRPFRPLQGLVVSLSLPDLLLQPEDVLRTQQKTLKTLVHDLHARLSLQVPLYLVLTKLDTVAGFREFFDPLPREEQDTVWGIAFPPTQTFDTEETERFFDQAYDQWIEALHKRLLKRLDAEKLGQSAQTRGLIAYFPQQLQLFKHAIARFIQHANTVQMRGIYFASAQQGEATYDFLMRSASSRFQTPMPVMPAQKPDNRRLFLDRLFPQAILPEAGWLTYGDSSRQFQHTFYRASSITAGTIILISILGLMSSHSRNQDNLDAIQRHLQDYRITVQQLAPQDTSLVNLLPTLDTLKQIRDVYPEASQQWLLGFELFKPFSIRNTVQSAWAQTFHNLFATRVGFRLEELMRSYFDANPELLYEALKGYLALGDRPQTRPSWIKLPLVTDLQVNMTDQPELQNRLMPYIDQLSTKLVKPLPLKDKLIEEVRKRLRQGPPMELVYYELKQAAEHVLPRIRLSELIGPRFSVVFDTINDVSIPALYTAPGFKRLHENQATELQQPSTDVYWVLGLTKSSDKADTLASQMTPTLWSRYSKDYTQNWQSALERLRIVRFTDLSHAIQVVTEVASAPNPIQSVLEAVQQNTAPIQSPQLKVAKAFESLNAVTNEAKDKPAPYKAVSLQLGKLRDYLTTLQSAPNSLQAQFDAAKGYMEGADSPMKQLKVLAQQMPSPLNQWLNQIADDSVGVLLQGARQVANGAWETTVYPPYVAELQGRFPFDGQAESVATLENFGQFFAPEGTMEKFIQTYIKPFVDTSKAPWKPLMVGNHSLGLPFDLLASLERANQIKTMYFAEGSKTPSAQFSIKPRRLDPQASSVNLQLGNHGLIYRHGPIEPIYVKWPLQGERQQAMVAITNFEGKTHSLTFSGPWAWFKLLKATQITAGNSGYYRWHIKQEGFTATFDVSASNNMPIFNLDIFEGLKLPEKL